MKLRRQSSRVSSFSFRLPHANLEDENSYFLTQKMVTIFMPNSKVRLTWTVFIFMVIWYNSLLTPVRIFIMSGERTPKALIAADIALDLIFVIDTILHFYFPFVDEDTGQVVTDIKQIRLKYRGSLTFYINSIACIPILKTPLSPLLDPKINIQLSTNFNALRMIRILHFPSQFNEIKRFRSQKGPVNESAFRMYIILFFTQLFMCMLGCLYFGWAASAVNDICHTTNYFDEQKVVDMWITEDIIIANVMNTEICAKLGDTSECNSCPQSLFFVRSVYFLMQTLFTIGYGDSVVPSRSGIEIVLACVFMLFGVFGYGLIIANMTSVLSNLDVVSMRYRHEMDKVNRWLTLRSVPESLRVQIDMFFTHMVRTQHGMLDHALFDDLAPQISRDLAEFNIPLLSKVPFFNPELRTKWFLEQIASVLIRRIYSPGSHILYEGEKQRDLVIIKSGRADIFVSGIQEAVGNLLEGDFIGDYQLLFGTINQIGVRSPDFTETLVLTFHNFERVTEHPLQNDVDLRSLGGNFRQSKDCAVVDTIERSQIFLKKLSSNISSLSNKHKSKKLQNIFETNKPPTNSFRISPHSPIHVYWDLFCLAAIMFYAISSPIRFSTYFRSKQLQEGFDNAFIIDYSLDIVFILDMILRIHFYTYMDFEGGRNAIIVDRELIRTKYLKSKWFPIDSFAAIPYDFLALRFGHFTLFRVPKLVRVSQIPRNVTRLQRNLDEIMNVTMNESQVSGTVMFLCSLLIVVWSSAGWNAIRTESNAFESVYWTFTTLTTVGYGDFTPSDFRETCYATIVGALGATFTASIIANVTSFFHNIDISEDNNDHKVNCIKCFMENHSYPFEQVKKTQEYFDYVEREQEGLNEKILLEQAVPDHIRNSILIHITQSMVTKCNLFTGCEDGFLRQIMLSLDQRFFGAQYFILTSSMPSDGMYFIKKGVVDLVVESGSSETKALKRLETGDSFAEGCLLEHWDKNPFLAITMTECESWFLSRSKFNRVVDDFPRARALLKNLTKTKQRATRRKSVHEISKAVQKAQRNAIIYIHPDNSFIQLWFGTVLMVTIYSIVIIPFRLAFMENYEISTNWVVTDYFCDFLLLIDIVIRTNFLAYYDGSHLVTQKKKIWAHYMKSGKMKWHLLSTLPFEFALVLHPTFCPLWKLQTWSFYRLNKILRVLEVRHLTHRVESSLAKAGVRVPKNAIRVGKLLLVILLSAHLVACVFYIIASFNQHINTTENQKNWAKEEGLFDSSPLLCPGIRVNISTMMARYIAALYWSMATLTTVGYGDITAHKDSTVEISFAIIILVIGTAIYTMVIALLEDIVSQLDVTSSLHKMKTDKVDRYIQSLGLPDIMKTKITAYYDNLWRTQRGVTGKKLLGFFPCSIRREIMLDMLSPLLGKTFFIKDCTSDFVAHILDFISLETYLPEDTVFHEGERCDSLLFLCKGEVDLLTSKKVNFKTVSNCVLGEASFFGLEPHICTAKAVDNCEIYALDMDDFVTCLHDNQLALQYCDFLKNNANCLLKSRTSMSKMINNLKSSKMEKMLVSDEALSIPNGIILPESWARQIWDLYALIQVAIFIIIIPYQISFSESGIKLSQFLIDIFMDMFFVLDIYAHLQKFAVVKDGLLVIEPKDFRMVYFRGDFLGDTISSIPASTISYISGVRQEAYGLMRLLQLTRVRRFGQYLQSSFYAFEMRTGKTISTALIRLLEIFFIVVFLCHWCACIYHFIGNTKSPNNWIVEDESTQEDIPTRYLRSFYWSLYTVTTIGYGSVPVMSNGERIFAMIVMAIGAVICDAGITAILTSIISTRDQQAGTNNRKIQCSEKFMKIKMFDQDFQNRVLDFYDYTDNELGNIREEEILTDLSASLRSDILIYFCFTSLRASELLSDLSDGAVQSLINTMHPYLAIPGEEISRIGEESDNMFVLQRGMMYTVDTSGLETLLPLGSIIGHHASNAITKKVGLPSKGLKIEILAAQGLRTKYGHPYIVFNVGYLQCRSLVNKAKDWKETVILKLPVITSKSLRIVVKSWHKNLFHSDTGSAEIIFENGTSGLQNVALKDKQGKCVGILKIVLTFSDLPPDEILESNEVTSIACGYCHLYKLKYYKLEQLRLYLKYSKQKRLYDRLKGNLFECNSQDDELTDKDRIQQGWQPPSHPRKYSNKGHLALLDSETTMHEENTSKRSLSGENSISTDNIYCTKHGKISDRNQAINTENELQIISNTIREDKPEPSKIESIQLSGPGMIKTGTLTAKSSTLTLKNDQTDGENIVSTGCDLHGDNIEKGRNIEENWDVLVKLPGQECDPNCDRCHSILT